VRLRAECVQVVGAAAARVGGGRGGEWGTGEGWQVGGGEPEGTAGKGPARRHEGVCRQVLRAGGDGVWAQAAEEEVEELGVLRGMAAAEGLLGFLGSIAVAVRGCVCAVASWYWDFRSGWWARGAAPGALWTRYKDANLETGSDVIALFSVGIVGC
jgi:hypothetical protein